MSDNPFGFGKVKIKFLEMKESFPKRLAPEILEHFLKNFDAEGFNGVGWQADKDKKKTGPILGGRNGQIAASLVIEEALFDNITIKSSLDWAGVHQYGDSSKNIPARPFIGTDEWLEKHIEEEISKELDKIFE